ncbi:MAG: hypothetical protein M3Y57_06615 [Acidobacteriota bacterium]|nr:hypothetical protein [Acidobacteriota bacterium]
MSRKRSEVLAGLAAVTGAVCLFVCGSTVVRAQVSMALTAPPLGAVFDASTGSLLPLQGVPGSAITGMPFAISPLSAAAISSEQGYALGVMADSGAVVLIRFCSGPVSQKALQAAAYPDRVVLSPTGTSAMLWNASRRTADIISDLPSAPVLKSLDLTSIDRDPDLFAISDDGATLLAAASSANPGNVYRFQNDAQQVIPYSGQIASIAFLRKSKDALLTDLTAQCLTRLRNATGTDPQFSTVPASVAIGSGEAIGVSRDNTRALLADPSSRSLTVIDLSAKTASPALNCHCSIADLTPLNGPFLFRLSEVSGVPLAIVDASLGKPSLTVVPIHHREAY